MTAGELPGEPQRCKWCPYALYAALGSDGAVILYCRRCDGISGRRHLPTGGDA